jgi:hypothetical protein
MAVPVNPFHPLIKVNAALEVGRHCHIYFLGVRKAQLAHQVDELFPRLIEPGVVCQLLCDAACSAPLRQSKQRKMTTDLRAFKAQIRQYTSNPYHSAEPRTMQQLLTVSLKSKLAPHTHLIVMCWVYNGLWRQCEELAVHRIVQIARAPTLQRKNNRKTVEKLIHSCLRRNGRAFMPHPAPPSQLPLGTPAMVVHGVIPHPNPNLPESQCVRSP